MKHKISAIFSEKIKNVKERLGYPNFPTSQFLWHGVVSPSFTIWVAPSDALQPEPSAFQNAPFLHRCYHIMRTAGLIPTFTRTQHRRKHDLVKLYWQNNQIF
jgi:hypothetical protein